MAHPEALQDMAEDNLIFCFPDLDGGVFGLSFQFDFVILLPPVLLR